MTRRHSAAEVFVLAGPSAGRRFRLGERISLGSDPQNDIVDDRLAPCQAVIEQTDGELYLEVLPTAQATMVDGKRVYGRARLREGAQVQAGPFTLELVLPTTIEPSAIAKVEAKVAPTKEAPWIWPRSGSKEVNPPEQVKVVKSEPELLLGPLEARSQTDLIAVGHRLQALVKTNALISAELNVERLFPKLLSAILDAIPAHRAMVMTPSPGSTELVVRATEIRPNNRSRVPQASATIARRAFDERVGVMTQDASSDARFDGGRSIAELDIRSAICAPILYQEEALGVIYLDTVGVTRRFTDADLQLLTAIAGPAGAAVRNANLVSKLRETAVDTIFRLSVAAEYRDDDTGYHIHRMSDYAETIARAMGQGPAYCELIKLASPMHDVGKIGIPDAVLKKPGKLSPEEFAVMKLHPLKGSAILANAHSEVLQVAEQIALNHHERFDGKGYPRGLEGTRIPLEGRIVALADVFDALVSKRCYKPAFPLDQALAELKKGRGTQFDPDVVDAFFASEGRILEIWRYYQRLEAEAPNNDTWSHEERTVIAARP